MVPGGFAIMVFRVDFHLSKAVSLAVPAMAELVGKELKGLDLLRASLAVENIK